MNEHETHDNWTKRVNKIKHQIHIFSTLHISNKDVDKSFSFYSWTHTIMFKLWSKTRLIRCQPTRSDLEPLSLFPRTQHVVPISESFSFSSLIFLVHLKSCKPLELLGHSCTDPLTLATCTAKIVGNRGIQIHTYTKFCVATNVLQDIIKLFKTGKLEKKKKFIPFTAVINCGVVI